MAYEFRERRNNGVHANYYWSDDDSDNEGNNGSNDPDYTRRGPGPTRRRAPTRNPTETPRQRRKLSTAAAAAAPPHQQCSTSTPAQPETEDKTVVSWLVSRGEVREGETVQCGVKEGAVTPDGILCSCCGAVMSVLEFRVHAGSSRVRPFDNVVVTRTNSSLLQHFMNAWNEGGRAGTRQFYRFHPKPGSEDDSDDVCQICADGGDLICCEQCPSTFHLGCTQMEALPEEWYCCYCKCNYCGESCEYRNKMACVQCGRAYHWQCFSKHEDLDLNNDEMGLFCSSKCRKAVQEIRSLVGIKFEINGGYTWSLIRRMEATEMEDDHKRMEWNSKIALAFEVLTESFMTIIDNYTGINILESVVNSTGSNLERVNFRGFYTLVLEKNGAVISAATLRVHDGEVAEMPYIATQHKYRLKGMSRLIFNAVTLVLSNIGVKNLVIPAIEDVADMWKGKYGFSPIDHEMQKKLTKYNTLMFPGTIRLQKRIICRNHIELV